MRKTFFDVHFYLLMVEYRNIFEKSFHSPSGYTLKNLKKYNLKILLCYYYVTVRYQLGSRIIKKIY